MTDDVHTRGPLAAVADEATPPRRAGSDGAEVARLGGHRALPVLSSDPARGRASSDLVRGSTDVPARPAAEGSILERRVELAELLDVRSFRDVCASFVELYKIGIKLFDVHGTKLVDIRVGSGDWCGYVFSNGEGRGLCTALVGRVKQHAYPALEQGEVIEQDCFSGLRYLIMPILHGGDVLGRVVYGPFLPEERERPGDTVLRFGDGFEPSKLWALGDKIRRVNDKTVRKIILNFRQVLDTVVATAYRAVLTQHLHLESVNANYKELAEANQRLRTSLEKQRELDRLKTNFLAMMSHELRTPLTSIIGYSDMLLEGMAGPLHGDQAQFVGTIREKGESLLELIQALLEISRVEAGVVDVGHDPYEIAAVLASAQRTVLPQAQKKGLRLQVHVDAGLPSMLGDPGKIAQCLINLLTNAVKFTPAGGEIRVHADLFDGERRYTGDDGRFGRPRERFVRVVVADTGIGIPADKVNRVFQAFYQVDNSFTREYGGTGLGLAIVKSFVEAHGGEVWVDSVEGHGTTFSLLLPVVHDRGGPAAIPS